MIPGSVLLPQVTRGSDIALSLTLSSGETPFDLSGYSAQVFDVAEVLNGRVTAQIQDGPGGVLSVDIEGTDPIEIGRHMFRVQLVSAVDDSVGLPAFFLVVI